MMMNYQNLKEISIDVIIEANEVMKETETEFNPYLNIIQNHQKIVEFGLTPVILVDPVALKFYLTTRERQENRLH